MIINFIKNIKQMPYILLVVTTKQKLKKPVYDIYPIDDNQYQNLSRPTIYSWNFLCNYIW